MIEQLRIQGFKCLRDVTVDLSPLTVFIGKNDTGKTSFLEAVSCLSELANGTATFAPPTTVHELLWRGPERASIEWTVSARAAAADARYQLAIEDPKTRPGFRVLDESVSGVEGGTLVWHSVESKVRFGAPDVSVPDRGQSGLGIARSQPNLRELHQVSEALRTTTRYRFDARQLAKPSSFQPSKESELPDLDSEGRGLASVLDYVLGTDRESFDWIEAELARALPNIQRVLLKPASVHGGPGKAIAFTLRTGEVVPAALASDGALLMLAYLTLVRFESPSIILIEEPENGIHPRALKSVMTHLTSLTQRSPGTQVLVVTHSPYLLDFVPPECVRVTGRKANGETVVRSLLELPGVKERIEGGFSVGELWFNVGEDKLLEEALR